STSMSNIFITKTQILVLAKKTSINTKKLLIYFVFENIFENHFLNMDNLYDNLDNYDEEINLEELRKENSELREKLIEHTMAMDKLQKNIFQDFNHLSTEFKKLEKNYSSLLKTAKDEIKRKTKMITDLNIEKDAMVLNVLQNRQPIRFRPIIKPQNIGQKEDTNNKDCKKKEPPGDQIERREQKCVPSTEAVARNDIIGPKQSSKTIEKYSNKETDFKENICNLVNSKNDIDKSASKLLSIKHRRKSMPAIRCEAKYDSDEEYDNNYHSHQMRSTVHCNRDRDSIKSQSDLLHKRFNNRRPPSTEDKYSNYDNTEPCRKTNYQEYERNRYRDSDGASRFTRQYSPDRQRYSRNNFHEYRQEYYRRKVLESPPPDKYRYHLRTRESRRYRDDYLKSERSKEKSQDKYTVKHKLPYDYDESSSKRRRNDSVHYPLGEKCKESDKVVVQTAIPTDIQFPSTSCQSPDYVDISTPQPIKEIKHTSTTKLDDPRLNNKCYVFDKNNDILSTVVDRNCDLKVLTRKDWNIESVEIPKALQRRPSQCYDDDENILDFEYAASDISAVTGELNFDTDEEYVRKISDNEEKIQPTPIKHIVSISENTTEFNNVNTEQSTKVSNIKENNIDEIKINNCSTLQNEQNLPIVRTKINCNNAKAKTDVSLRKMVEGDLELSDDTCDVTDVYAEKDDKKSAKEQDNKNNYCLESIPTATENNIIIDIPNDEQSSLPADKPQKQRKLSQKPNKKVQSDRTKGKKTKLKNESKGIKTKFCELFGDSSSLITPEDLGIVNPVNDKLSTKSIPLCEDAQDAVELKITNMDNTENCFKSAKLIVNNDEASMDTLVKDVVTICNNIACSDISKCSNVENKDIAIKNFDKPHNVVMEVEANDNVIDDDKIKDSTVTKNVTRSVAESVAVQNILIKPDSLLKALATSTPEKDFLIQHSTSVPEKSLQNEKNTAAHDNEDRMDQSSITNSLDSETDVPDVRIFVKRRRKLLRKPKINMNSQSSNIIIRTAK
ncbi:hypothetical protein ACJJTC_019630, partial [Scirpophaga incertulas]